MQKPERDVFDAGFSSTKLKKMRVSEFLTNRSSNEAAFELE